jgi:hypothetical protein
MTKETFQKIILKIHLINTKDHEFYKLGVDLSKYSEDHMIIIQELMEEVFNKDQLGWIEWYLYERESLTRKDKPNKAWKTDKETGKKIEICYDIDSLWETVQEYNN